MGEITSVLKILKLRKTTFYDLITNKHTKHGGDTLKKNAPLSYLTQHPLCMETRTNNPHIQKGRQTKGRLQKLQISGLAVMHLQDFKKNNTFTHNRAYLTSCRSSKLSRNNKAFRKITVA